MLLKIFSWATLLAFSHAALASSNTAQAVLESLETSVLEIQNSFQARKNKVKTQSKELDKLLSEKSLSKRKTCDYLLQKYRLSEQLEELTFQEEFEISKVRYVKGLQVVKILYEKVLSLDHHFASTRTFHEINKLSNPNSFQSFSSIRQYLDEHKKRNSGIQLPELLEGNIFASFAEILINISGSDLNKDQKEDNLKEIQCIMDFSLRMYNDLHLIYFETSFLEASNADIKSSIENLFKDYTKSIGYAGELSNCRLLDDWEGVEEELDEYITEALNEDIMKKSELLVNLKFPIDRLVQFINQYNNFIDEGKKYYQKFDIILSSYENYDLCKAELPIEFDRLKSDMNLAVEKFAIAYKPVEINGSRMKEILYGLD